MKFLSFVLLITSSFFFECNKRNECDCAKTEDVYLKAKVLLTSDVSCGTPVLDFTEDSSRIRYLTNREAIQYSVIKLPANLNIVNNKLYVLVTALNPAEEYACNTLGIVYPHLKVEYAKNR